MRKFLLLVSLCFYLSCEQKPGNATAQAGTANELRAIAPDPVYSSIGAIKVPGGFMRIPVSEGSFTNWLRSVPLKADKTVYLFNGSKKRNQSAQFAVIDMPTGSKDLQQCADVVMRLRAEYLFQYKKYSEIAFMDYAGKWYRFNGGDSRASFDNYLQQVFGWCGSASLEKQLTSVRSFNDIKPGDVLVQGGFPGHAVIVADMATNEKGQKIYLLVQGYQPAQDMHVLVNAMDPSMSPWYTIGEEEPIYTPEWTFTKSNLKTW